MGACMWFTTNQGTQTELYATECWVCGIAFAWPNHLDDRARERGTDFYCPNGHKIRYGESEASKLRRQLAAEEGYAATLRHDLKHAENRVRAEKAAKTKLKKRIAAGVCPCCTRSFQNLTQHMKTQHPDYVAADAKVGDE